MGLSQHSILSQLSGTVQTLKTNTIIDYKRHNKRGKLHSVDICCFFLCLHLVVEILYCSESVYYSCIKGKIPNISLGPNSHF